MEAPKLPAYSFTRLDNFKKCPWAYKKIYQDKMPRTQDPSRDIGLLSHKKVAEYITRLLELGLETDWEWVDQQLRDLPLEVGDIIQTFTSHFRRPLTWEEPGVERQIAFNRRWEPTGWFDADAYFRMVIDLHFRQEGLAVVKDWKTSRQVPKNLEKDMQTRLYGWGVHRAFYPQAEEILLVLHFLRYGAERKILLEPADLAGVPALIDEAVYRIEAEKKFAPTPGDYCGLCGVVAHCPAMEKAVIPQAAHAPITPEQALEAVGLLLAMETVRKNLTKYLKIWVRMNGPVQINGLEYGPGKVTEWILDPKKITTLALEKGMSKEVAWAMLKASKDSIESVLRAERKREFLQEFLDIGHPEESEQIRFRRIKDVEAANGKGESSPLPKAVHE